MATESVGLKFNGSNWEDLDRIVGLASFKFLQDGEYDDEPVKQCAFLAAQFEGPALDWSISHRRSTDTAFNDFGAFVVAVKQAFGVEATGITALRRRSLEDLRWGRDVPVFFAEFDRLTLQLGIADHGTRILMVREKLPLSLKSELARQALEFHNYETMRERLISMWALDPLRGAAGPSAVPNKKTKCGSCGKRGHTASNCRGGSKN